MSNCEKKNAQPKNLPHRRNCATTFRKKNLCNRAKTVLPNNCVTSMQLHYFFQEEKLVQSPKNHAAQECHRSAYIAQLLEEKIRTSV